MRVRMEAAAPKRGVLIQLRRKSAKIKDFSEAYSFFHGGRLHKIKLYSPTGHSHDMHPAYSHEGQRLKLFLAEIIDI